MTGRRRALATFFAVLLAISAAIAAGVSKTASAMPGLICTWTGVTNNDISVANNWSLTSGQTCGGPGTTSGSAQLLGAELVFPSPIPTGSVLTVGASESVDDLVFEDDYTISGSNTLTLTPSANGSVGIDVASGAGPTINAPIVLGQSQTFAVAQGKSLYLGGAISGPNDSLTFGNPGNTGYIELDKANSYSGGATVAYGSAEIRNSQSLGTGAVTVDSGASLLEYSGSATVDPANSLTLSGTGSVGYAGALEDYTGGSSWGGPITLAGSVTLAAESKSNPFAITGSIGGTGPLALSGTGTFKFSGGSSNFSGATTIASQTTLISEVANALPSTTSLAVGSYASYDLNSYAQSISGLSGSGSVTSSPAAATTLTISPSGTDSVGTAITGNIGLTVAGSGTVILGSSSNTYSQNTKVLSGILQNGAANAVPSGSSVTVDSSGTFDLAGFNQTFSDIAGPGVITSSSGTPLLSVDIGSGATDTWSGTLTGSLGLATPGPGTLVVSSLGNSYSGATTVGSGTAEINGSVTNSVFAVSAGATLEGSGTVGGISSNAGVVHPGTSPGILTSNGASTLGSGTLAIDITGSQAGSGYSQLVASGNSVDVSGATLSVSDSYAAPYDTIFTIVSGGSVTGTFSNVSWGANLAVGGRSLLLGKTSDSITLTDVTDPPSAPAPTTQSGPVPPLPPSGAVSYTGASSRSPSGTAVAANDQTTVTANGYGAIMLSQFGSDPVGPPNFIPADEYFDVRSSADSSFSSLTIKDCNLNGGDVLEWWNRALNSGIGQWQPVFPAAVLEQSVPPCLTFTVTNTSEPSLTQLSDAIFAVAKDPVSTPDGKGYWLTASDGGVFSFGDAQFYGSMGGKFLAMPVVGIASTPDGKGYWLTASDGGVFSFGDAQFYGSMGGKFLAMPVVGIASTPDGKGYWLTASDGGVFSFGDAQFYGSMGGKFLAMPVVGIASTPDGKGYWLTASDGGVFSFGDAQFYGSMGGKFLAMPVVGIASTPDGKGYWLTASDGGVFSFGDAQFYGSMGGKFLAKPVVGITSTPSGGGYWLAGQDGGVFSFGNAGFYGSLADSIQVGPISAVTASPSGKGYWLVASDGSISGFGDAAYHSSLAGEPISNPVVGIASSPDCQGFLLSEGDGGVISFGDAHLYGSMGGNRLNAAIVGIAYDS